MSDLVPSTTAPPKGCTPSRQSFGAERRSPVGQPLRETPCAGETWSDPERVSTGGVSGLCPFSRLAERGAALPRSSLSAALPASRSAAAGVGLRATAPRIGQHRLEHIVDG